MFGIQVRGLDFSYEIEDFDDWDWGQVKIIRVTLSAPSSKHTFTLNSGDGSFKRFVNMICDIQEKIEQAKKFKENK